MVVVGAGILGLWVVTGPGGRGMTLAPAIAEETVAMIESAR
jgi:glycine/D-amino acid oxidase-like deaminating enzyme